MPKLTPSCILPRAGIGDHCVAFHRFYRVGTQLLIQEGRLRRRLTPALNGRFWPKSTGRLPLLTSVASSTGGNGQALCQERAARW